MLIRRNFPVFRKVILFFGTMLIVMISALWAINIVTSYCGVQINLSVYIGMLPFMMAVVAFLTDINGLYSLSRKKYSEVFIGLVVTMFNVCVVMMAISFFLREFSYSRSILLVTVTIQFVILSIWYYLFWRIEHKFMIPRNALVFGTKEESERLVSRLEANLHLKDHVKYICTNLDNEQWLKVSEDIDLIIVCPSLNLQDKAKIVHFCHVYSKQVFIIPEFYEVFCSSIDLDKIDDIPVFRPRYLAPTLEQRLLKRLLDLGVSVSVLACFWPIFLIVALAVKLDGPGSVFYSQIRCSRDGGTFKLYKFRTMCQDAEKNNGPVLAAANDARITRAGRFLRATRLDELPQLINVLIGDMSIVGPRPERPFFVEQFQRAMPEYVYRFNVKPGITGLAQVYGKYNTSAQNKLIYDLIYIQKCNVITDLVIMLQTLRVLLTKSSTEGIKNETGDFDVTNCKSSNYQFLS